MDIGRHKNTFNWLFENENVKLLVPTIFNANSVEKIRQETPQLLCKYHLKRLSDTTDKWDKQTLWFIVWVSIDNV